MKPIKKIQLGKKGLTPEFIEQVRKIFEKESLLKISILKSACRNKQDAIKIADNLKNSLGKKFNYRLIGYTITLMKFRKNQ